MSAGGAHQHQQVLLLFKGHPGVGKSTLARAVCRHLGWSLIDKDDARDCLQQQLQPQLLEGGLDANQLSYALMFSFCNTQLSLGLSTALDCPFARVSLYQQAVALAQKHGAVVAVVECVAGTEAVWRQQLESRAAQQQDCQASAHKPQTWEELQQLLQRYGDCWKWTQDGSCAVDHLLVLDTTAHSVQAQVAAVDEFLAKVRGVSLLPGVGVGALDAAVDAAAAR